MLQSKRRLYESVIEHLRSENAELRNDVRRITEALARATGLVIRGAGPTPEPIMRKTVNDLARELEDRWRGAV